MRDETIHSYVHDLWKTECRTLPIIAVLAAAVCLVALIWRLDQLESGSFFVGMLVGAVVTCVIASLAFVIRLGRAIRGGRKSSLIVDAIRLARGQ